MVHSLGSRKDLFYSNPFLNKTITNQGNFLKEYLNLFETWKQIK